jgi:hypothetical protein
MSDLDSPTAIVERGLNGWHGQAPPKGMFGTTRISYRKPLSAILPDLPDGCWVLDKERCPDIRRGVLSGPMVDVGLAPDEEDRFTDALRKRAQQMKPLMSGGMDTLVDNEAKGFCSLDSVGLDLYLDYWRAFEGIRVGRVTDGKVVWEGS